MKTIPIALAAHQAGDTTTLAHALRITRSDGQVFAFTSAGRSEPIDGVTYRADQGLTISNIDSTAGFGVDSLELTTLDDGSLFDHADIRAGVWQNAKFLIFRYNWASPADGVEYLLAGIVGNITQQLGTIRAELRGLQQYLQQPLGSVTSKTCRARLADQPSPNGNNVCGLSAAAWTDALTITGITDPRRIFTVSTARAVDWFSEGLATFTGGANAGLKAKIKTHSTGGVIELLSPLQRDLVVGDTLSALAGCRKRRSDCRDKFGNVVNFQGEPDLPGVDALTATPDASA